MPLGRTGTEIASSQNYWMNGQKFHLPCGVGSHFINIKMVQSTTEPLEHTIVLMYLCYKAGISKTGIHGLIFS